jgi:hypothetical protein
MSPAMERLDIEQALFGSEAVQIPDICTDGASLHRQRNGFWMSGGGPENRRVSAVLTALGLHYWNAPRVIPHLWLNPWAVDPLNEQWPFPTATTSDRGRVSYRDVDPHRMYALLDLPNDWPGGRPWD